MEALRRKEALVYALDEEAAAVSMGNILTLIIGGGIAAFISAIGQIVMWKLNRRAKKQDDETEHEKHIRKALCVILYDRIKYLARHHIGAGFVTVEDLEDLTKMHSSYKDDLGGNGFLDNLMSQVKTLPLHK
jgi:heme/copper-type cytochrome/quinol oxidase subunit 2